MTFSEARQANLAGHGVSPMPREMAFPVPKGEKWHDHYDYIRYARYALLLAPPELLHLSSGQVAVGRKGG